MANHHDRPIWMHPARPGSRADYPGEPKSKYEIWQGLGWPFETSVAMARMVFSGLLEKLPKLRIITHHCGGMIPYFAGRAETLWAQLGSRSSECRSRMGASTGARAAHRRAPPRRAAGVSGGDRRAPR